VSLSLEDSLRGCLRSGESLEEALAALAALAGAAQLQAVLLNCCAPAAVSHAMPLLRQAAPEGEPPDADDNLLC
jgi:S-methylmethionine-dependent homocysteine/selenocysteine methylase